jgi:signal transduction histidine kinase
VAQLRDQPRRRGLLPDAHGGALKKRERELAAAREAALRNEQILSLGTLAAGAAHQLGTPLATMAVVIRELELQPWR